ncbi:MAG: tyrosine-type recombinase/integrase [Comamonas sp.]
MKREDIKRRPLSDTTIESLEPEATMYRERHADGVYLRVKPDGGKDWQLRYKRPDGKWTWMGLGGYGKAGHQLTGQEARHKANELARKAKAEGIALSEVNKPSVLVIQPAETFAVLMSEWLETKRGKWATDTYIRTKRMLELHVAPVMGERAFVSIQPAEWFALFQSIERQGIIETLSKTRSSCRDIYTFAQIQGRAQVNPIDGQHKFLAASKNQNLPHVPQDEISELIRDIRGFGSRPIAIGLQLLMLLAVRPSELREAQWAEFDCKKKLWTVPSERKKERREFQLPLASQAIKLLQELQEYSAGSLWLFPGRDDRMNAPISNMTFNQALHRMGYKDRQTPHGLRHLFSTTANNAGKDYRIVDSALAHKIKGVEAVYNKASYLDQRRELMQWWADHIDALACQLERVKSAS